MSIDAVTATPWKLWTFSDAEIKRALKAANARHWLSKGWRGQRGTMMTDDGNRTGQVALRTHGTPVLVVTPFSSRDRLHVVSRLMERKREA